MVYKDEQGKTLYPICSWDDNQHKLYAMHDKIMNAITDAEEANEDTEDLYANLQKLEVAISAFDNGVGPDGIVYARYDIGQAIKEYILMYDLRSDELYKRYVDEYYSKNGYPKEDNYVFKDVPRKDIDNGTIFDLGDEGGEVKLACLGRYVNRNKSQGGPILVLNDLDGNQKFKVSENVRDFDIRDDVGCKTTFRTMVTDPEGALPVWFPDREIGSTQAQVVLPTKDGKDKVFNLVYVDLHKVLHDCSEGKEYIEECIIEEDEYQAKNAKRWQELEEINEQLTTDQFDDMKIGDFGDE